MKHSHTIKYLILFVLFFSTTIIFHFWVFFLFLISGLYDYRAAFWNIIKDSRLSLKDPSATSMYKEDEFTIQSVKDIQFLWTYTIGDSQRYEA